jgi:uncharacterized protein (DUF1919 family)
MEKFDLLALETLIRYFEILKYTGYIKDYEVNNLIFILFIRKLVHQCSIYMTDDDYRKINNILSCIYSNSCLVPYHGHLVSMPYMEPYIELQYDMDDGVKLTENEKARLTSL